MKLSGEGIAIKEIVRRTGHSWELVRQVIRGERTDIFRVRQSSLEAHHGNRVPDAKTIWLFREHLAQAKAVENLFARFDKHLAKAGYLAMGGKIVEATIVAAPKKRNTDAEKADIKAGKVPDAWKDKPAKLRQKDRDAR